MNNFIVKLPFIPCPIEKHPSLVFPYINSYSNL